MNARDALPRILAALTDPEDREAALQALGDLGSRGDLAKALALEEKSGSSFDREWAWWRIGTRDPGAVPAVAELLGHRDADTRSRAARTLARLGAAASAPKLVELLGDPDVDVRFEAARALGVLSVKGSAEALERLLKDPHSGVRRQAAQSLCRWGLRAGAAPLVEEHRGGTPLLSPLNAFRRPEEWERLAGKRLERSVQGPIGIVLRRLASRAGLRIDFSAVEGQIAEQLWATAQEGWTLAEALDHALMGTTAEYVLEPGVLKLLRIEEARDFWRAWKK
jgi:hypothetical protein